MATMRLLRSIRAQAALAAAVLLAGCGASSNVQAQAGETVQTALFAFSVSDPQTLETYDGVEVPQGQKLVQVTLTVENTTEAPLPMFAEDFQIQWGDGDTDFGACLAAVDDTMVPYSYEVAPGESYTGAMLVTVPQDCGELTVAYQDVTESGDRAAAYFVEVPL